jgi:hypothetical protein
VNEGQKCPTALGIASSNASEVFACVEKSFYFLASLGWFFIIGDLCAAIRLAREHGVHVLIMKHLPNRIAVIGLVHHGCVQRGEGG